MTVLAALDTIASAASAYGPPTALDMAANMASLVGLVVAYALVRKGRTTWGVITALLVMQAAIWAYRVKDSGPGETQLLYFLVVPLLLGGLLLRGRAAYAMAVATIVSSVAFEAYLDKRSGQGLNSDDASLILLLGAVASISVVAARFAEGDAQLLDRRTAELEAASEALREAMAERARMFNQIAHDLANPLSPILLQTRILATADAEGTAKGLAIIRRNLELVQRQVDDLKELARLESGRMKLTMAPLDLSALAREAVESFRAGAQERQLSLQAASTGPLVVPGDRARINQALYNLVGNALKFTPSGGMVSVKAAADGNLAVIDVVDTGRGLSAEDIARLFRPFSQAHSAGEIPERGSGLGLYIAKGIVEAHGGTIGVASAGRGQGSTFTFRLPLG